MRTAVTCSVLLLALLTLPLQAAQPRSSTEDFLASLQATARAASPDSPPATDLQTRPRCTALCWDGSTVSCLYHPSTTCNSVASNCPSTQGYVTCGGVTTYCPPCPECEENSFQLVSTGNCCAYNQEEFLRSQCVGGHWEYLDSPCLPSQICLDLQ